MEATRTSPAQTAPLLALAASSKSLDMELGMECSAKTSLVASCATLVSKITTSCIHRHLIVSILLQDGRCKVRQRILLKLPQLLVQHNFSRDRNLRSIFDTRLVALAIVKQRGAHIVVKVKAHEGVGA